MVKETSFSSVHTWRNATTREKGNLVTGKMETFQKTAEYLLKLEQFINCEIL